VSFIGFLLTEAYQNLRAVRLCVSDGLALQHMTSTADGRVIPPCHLLSWAGWYVSSISEKPSFPT